MEDFNPDRDFSKVRSLHLDNNKINFKQVDPYGFWTVQFDKGQMPKWLQGQYTSYEDAEKDVQRYLIEKKRTLKE